MDSQSEQCQLPPNSQIAKERYGLVNYTLIASENTGLFINQCVKKCRQIIQKSESENEKLPIAQIVAQVLVQEVESHIYFPRLLLGGKHHLEDVVNNASCFDINVLAQMILCGLGIQSHGETTSLLMIPKHYFTVTEKGEVIDLFVRGKRYPDGYFRSMTEYQARLKQVNSLGLAGIGKQAKKLIIAK